MNSADTLFRNVRTALRVLARAPGFTATVVLTIALGIGAASAVFCAIDVVLLRPLPFPESERLVRLSQVDARLSEAAIAPPRLEDWSRFNSAFEAITGYYFEDVSDTTEDLPQKIRRAFVASRFFDVLKIAPAVGRAFTPEDYKASGSIMISDRYWRARFSASSAVSGKRVRIGDKTYTVVGVMPAAFSAIDREVDVFAPVTSSPLVFPRQATIYTGLGRLKPGVSLAQAQSNMSLVQAQLARQYPDTDRVIDVRVVALKDSTVGGVQGSLWLLFGSVSVLLLIACTNIAALVLSRSAQREQEIAIRFSLGSSRGAVMSQLLTECALLAFAGAVLGVLVAAALSVVFRSLAPDLPRVDEIVINWRVLAFALAAAVSVTLLCGLPPAIRSTRGSESLRQAGRTQVSARHSVQWGLVGVQVALSVTLLIGAGLLLRSFERLMNVNRGFNPQNVLTFNVSAVWAETTNFNAVVQRINGTIDAIASLPMVRAVATTSGLPGVPARMQSQMTLDEGQNDPSTPIAAEGRLVSPRYFEVLQIPLLSGELCKLPTSAVSRDTVLEVMVNRTFVTRYVGNRSPIGLHLSSPLLNSQRIVGVVGDARENGIDSEPPPVVYGCNSAPTPMPRFLIRTNGDPMRLANAVRLKVREIAPLRSVYDLAPLEERIGDAFAQNRLRAILLASFAAAALALACLGVYGTLSYIVTLRQREVGLWLALGAMRGDVIVRFLRKTLLVVGIACLAGVALSLALSRVISGMLFGVAAADPATFSVVIAMVMLVGTLAALLPSVRAAILDPMQTLREE